MNTMDDKKKLSTEEKARREYETLCDPQTVRVRVPVLWKDGICYPIADGTLYEEAEFKVLTFGDNHVLDKACSYDMEIRNEGNIVSKISVTDVNEYRMLLVRRNLLSWTLDIPIERQNGWMTERCWNRVKKVPAPLMEAFIERYDTRVSVTKEEEEKIMRQSTILFSKNSRGVMDACEAISLFCTLGNFWEKFGVGRGVPIHEMPFKEYIMLKMVIGKENEFMKVVNSPKKPLTRIAGPGGRPRASKGIVVGD